MLLVRLQPRCTEVEIKNRDRLVRNTPSHCQFDSGTRLSGGKQERQVTQATPELAASGLDSQGDHGYRSGPIPDSGFPACQIPLSQWSLVSVCWELSNSVTEVQLADIVATEKRVDCH